jgi:hypothetical protein
MLVVLVGTHPDELKENFLHDVKAVLVPDASPESVNGVVKAKRDLKVNGLLALADL